MHNKDGSAMRLLWHRSSSAPLEEKNGKICTHFPIRRNHHPKTAVDEEANSNLDMDISCCCSVKKNLSGYSFLQRARLLLHATLHTLVLSHSSSSTTTTPTINRITKADNTHTNRYTETAPENASKRVERRVLWLCYASG
jgi:hypothetical protein